MLTEQDLISGEVNASDDLEGVDVMIQNLFNEIAKKRVRVIQLHREKKSEEALELTVTANEMQSELDDLIKSQLNYLKYLKARGQTNGKDNLATISQQLKEIKSNVGSIVQNIPKVNP